MGLTPGYIVFISQWSSLPTLGPPLGYFSPEQCSFLPRSWHFRRALRKPADSGHPIKFLFTSIGVWARLGIRSGRHWCILSGGKGVRAYFHLIRFYHIHIYTVITAHPIKCILLSFVSSSDHGPISVVVTSPLTTGSIHDLKIILARGE
jgi:hypothetical protein